MKTIPKKLEPLAKEARKYKTGEAFEKAIRKTRWVLAECFRTKQGIAVPYEIL